MSCGDLNLCSKPVDLDMRNLHMKFDAFVSKDFSFMSNVNVLY